MAPPAVPHGDIQGQQGEFLQQDGDEVAFQQHWVTSHHGDRAGDRPVAGGEACAAQQGTSGQWELLRLRKKPPLVPPATAQEFSGSLPLQPCQLNPSPAHLAWRAWGLRVMIPLIKAQAASHGGASHGNGEIAQNRAVSPGVPGLSNVPKQLGHCGAVPAAVPRQSIPRDCGGSGNVAGCLASTHEAAHSCGCS